jgi:hypothetical protein
MFRVILWAIATEDTSILVTSLCGVFIQTQHRRGINKPDPCIKQIFGQVSVSTAYIQHCTLGCAAASQKGFDSRKWLSINKRVIIRLFERQQ